jgi:hypothetical protein
MSDQHDARFIREVAIRYVGARQRCPDAIPASIPRKTAACRG